MSNRKILLILAGVLFVLGFRANADPEQRIKARHEILADVSPEELPDIELLSNPDYVNAWIPAGTEVLRDLAYGSAPKQTLDVYLPAKQSKNAPVIFIIHGGAWRFGDKAHKGTVQNKVTRWVPKGFIVVSINYPLVPEAGPLDQAKSVAKALAYTQSAAAQWGGDSNKFVLIGHASGAHIATLLNADPQLATAQGAKPWLGTVAIDDFVMDVVELMSRRHLRSFDRIFGEDPEYWLRVSPARVLAGPSAPILLPCSLAREPHCKQANLFADAAKRYGSQASVLPVDLSLSDTDRELGVPGPYTEQVESFLAMLDPQVKAMLLK